MTEPAAPLDAAPPAVLEDAPRTPARVSLDLLAAGLPGDPAAFVPLENLSERTRTRVLRHMRQGVPRPLLSPATVAAQFAALRELPAPAPFVAELEPGGSLLELGDPLEPLDALADYLVAVAATALAGRLVDALAAPELEGPLAAAARAAADSLMTPYVADARFAAGVRATLRIPGTRSGLDVLDPAGRREVAPSPAIWTISPAARREPLHLTPATAPRELIVSPAWMTPQLAPAELDDPTAIARRWNRAAGYAQQGIELRARHAEAAALLPYAARRSDRRELEDRAARLAGWVDLYASDAPAVLASLGPFAELLHAVGETADPTRSPRTANPRNGGPSWV
jgi:hypothetical protein